MRLTDLALDLRVPKNWTRRLLEHRADAGWAEQGDATGRLAWPFSHVAGLAARRWHA